MLEEEDSEPAFKSTAPTYTCVPTRVRSQEAVRNWQGIEERTTATMAA